MANPVDYAINHARLTIAALAFLLIAGGVKLTLSRQTRVRGALMITAGLVIVMNVMIWIV